MCLYIVYIYNSIQHKWDVLPEREDQTLKIHLNLVCDTKYKICDTPPSYLLLLIFMCLCKAWWWHIGAETCSIMKKILFLQYSVLLFRGVINGCESLNVVVVVIIIIIIIMLSRPVLVSLQQSRSIFKNVLGSSVLPVDISDSRRDSGSVLTMNILYQVVYVVTAFCITIVHNTSIKNYQLGRYFCYNELRIINT